MLVFLTSDQKKQRDKWLNYAIYLKTKSLHMLDFLTF